MSLEAESPKQETEFKAWKKKMDHVEITPIRQRE
jgi:hypothetical protein